MPRHHTTQRAELRKTLLDNGYLPLPLAAKGVFIKGWSRVDIDADWLDKHRRDGRWRNTGLRCDNLLAFDIDVLDEDLADDCEAEIERVCGDTDFCRVGRAPKRLLLYRLNGDDSRSMRTGQYGGHMVELLCSNGRQFAAYGTHPGTGRDYEWLDSSPESVAWDELPSLTYEKAVEAMEACEALLEASGLERTRIGYTSRAEGRNSYDLLDDTPVEVAGLRTTWGEVKNTLDGEGAFGNLYREEYEDWGDSSAVHFFVASGTGQPCAHDFVHDTTHWESTWRPEVAELLPPPPEPQDNRFIPDDMADLQTNCVLLRDKTVRRLSNPMRAYPLDGFRASMQHLQVPDPNAPKSNPGKTMPYMKEWEQDPSTMRADYAAMRPDHPDDSLVRVRSEVIMNTYLPPDLPSGGGETETFWQFMDHLFPHPDYVDIFTDWLAYKVAHPGARMHGMVCVTKKQGTGRGTLVQIMESLFGLEYVSAVELSDLVGDTGQSVYNSYLADSLMVTVAEALEEKQDQSRWSARHLAYERLKVVCDPAPGRMYVRRKYGRNGIENIYASLFISSNHLDALAIEQGDRRLIILDNGDTALVDAPGDLYGRIHAWKRDPANIGALHRELQEIAAESHYDPMGEPPATRAKDRMVESSQSDTDRLYEHWLDEAAGDICTAAQWRTFAASARLKYDLDVPSDPSRRDQALQAVIQQHAIRPEGMNKTGNMKIDGTVVRPWIIRNFERWRGSDDRAAIKAELLKNGPLGGSVVELPGK